MLFKWQIFYVQEINVVCYLFYLGTAVHVFNTINASFTVYEVSINIKYKNQLSERVLKVLLRGSIGTARLPVSPLKE